MRCPSLLLGPTFWGIWALLQRVRVDHAIGATLDQPRPPGEGLIVEARVDGAPVQGAAVCRTATEGGVVLHPRVRLVIASRPRHQPKVCHQLGGLLWIRQYQHPRCSGVKGGARTVPAPPSVSDIVQKLQPKKKKQLPATVFVESMCPRNLHACAASASAGAAPPTTGRLINLG